MPTECMNLSNLTLAEAQEGRGALGWGRTRQPRREEGRRDLGRCPRRMDTQKAKTKSKLRWTEAYTQGARREKEHRRDNRGRMPGFREDRMCPWPRTGSQGMGQAN